MKDQDRSNAEHTLADWLSTYKALAIGLWISETNC